MDSEFFQQEGLLIAIPKNLDRKAFARMLSAELAVARKIKDVKKRKEVCSLINEAIKMFPHYPNRLMRLYVHADHGCPNDIYFNWKNPAEEIQKPLYWYNPPISNDSGAKRIVIEKAEKQK